MEDNTNHNIFDIDAIDRDNVILCMQLADNGHDFGKGRSDLNSTHFKQIEKISSLNKYLIKNSPSTIEEATYKQLSINTGLYKKSIKSKQDPKGKHTPILYNSPESIKKINNLLHHQNKNVDIFINENTNDSLAKFIEFINGSNDVSLSVTLERNLDGKKIFTDKLRILCKGLLLDLFTKGDNFFFMLDASNISFKKLFYKSTKDPGPSARFVHHVEETNKWDMASNIMPQLKNENIKTVTINRVIMEENY